MYKLKRKARLFEKPVDTLTRPTRFLSELSGANQNSCVNIIIIHIFGKFCETCLFFFVFLLLLLSLFILKSRI